MELDRKIAVVTGASRGIGRSIALTLADAGADLVGCDLLIDDLEEVVKDFEGRGTTAILKGLDMFFSFQRWKTMRRSKKLEKLAGKKG